MTLSRVHALTASELALLRTRVPAARTDLFLAIWPMFQGSKGDPFNATVWTGRVDEPLGTVDDRLYEIDYDGGSGAGDFGDTLPDMTVYVGTSAGDDDLGRARLRGWQAGSTGVAGTMLLGEMSEIEWQDNAYLTVIDDFNLWPRHLYIDGAGVLYIDHGYYDEVAAANVDGSYTDQHRYPDPVPVMGPDAVLWMPDSGNARVYFDASNSFALDGGALTYTWAFPGSVANGGLNVAATWAEYNAAGVYRADCQVSRNYAPVAAFTGHRRVWVFDDDNMPTVKFELQDCSGDYSSGGWSYRVTMWDEARRDEIVDRARCVLFARDWFNGTEQSVGPYYTDQHGGRTLRANVVCNGWVSGESIAWDNEKGSVNFDVQGPQHWFAQMMGFPHGVENSDAVPTGWFQYQDLTVRDGLWSFLRWRTTTTRMMDIELTTDSREIAVFSTPIGTIWDQLVAGSLPAILAPPVCDRYGALIVEIPINHEFTANRAGTPTVIDMSASDWRDQIDITRRTVAPRGMTDLSGVYYADSTTATAFFALSYGHIFGRYGKIQRQERLALFSAQATNNSLSGLVQADAVKEYPAVDYRLAGNYRVFDIVPRQRVQQSIAAADTERGIVWNNKLLLPRSVSFAMQDGLMLVDMTCEEETGEAAAVDGEPPPTTPDPPIEVPDWPEPQPEPDPPAVNLAAVVLNEDQCAITFDATVASPDWYDLDPNGDLVGRFANIGVNSSGEAVITTYDPVAVVPSATTGIWYCSDIFNAIDATISWTLIKSASAAYIESAALMQGLPYFQSVWVDQSSGIFGVLLHGDAFINQAPPATVLYWVNAGVTSFLGLPTIANKAAYCIDIGAGGTNHAIWGGGGTWYVGVRYTGSGAGWVVYTSGAAWSFIAYGPLEPTRIPAVNNGYVIGHSDDIYNNWNTPLVANEGEGRSGIRFESTHYSYTKNDGAFDLYLSGTKIADAVNEFGAGREGGYAGHLVGTDETIAWVVGNANATGVVAIMTTDATAVAPTWANITGDLLGVVGGAWTGWTASTHNNCIIRLVEL